MYSQLQTSTAQSRSQIEMEANRLKLFSGRQNQIAEWRPRNGTQVTGQINHLKCSNFFLGRK